jgi:hypothetical protein
MNEAHPHTANERPDASIVIVAGKVEQIHRVVGAPVRIAGLQLTVGCWSFRKSLRVF